MPYLHRGPLLQVLLLLLLGSLVISLSFAADCDGETTSILAGIPCDSTGCVYSGGLLTIDATSMSKVALCFDVTLLTTISLTSVIVQIGSLTQSVMMRANSVKLTSFTISNTNNFAVLGRLSIEGSLDVTLTQTSFEGTTTASVISANTLTVTGCSFNTTTLILSTTNALTINQMVLTSSGNASIVSSASDVTVSKLNVDEDQYRLRGAAASKISLISAGSLTCTNSFILVNFAAIELISSATLSLDYIFLLSKSSLTVTSNSQIEISNAQVKASRVLIFSESASIVLSDYNSFTASQRVCKSDCVKTPVANNPRNCVIPTIYPVVSLLSGSSQSIADSLQRYGVTTLGELVMLAAGNFTVTVVSLAGVSLINTSVIGSNVGVYAQQLSVDEFSQISSTNLGCLGAHGAGAGIADAVMRKNLLCGGPGGSYGMIGGSPASEKSDYNNLCQMMSGQPMYGDPDSPVYEGSGGGGYLVAANTDSGEIDASMSMTETNAGQGGGFVYIETVQLQLNGAIDTSGGSPYKDYAYLGSGSGGSVWVSAANVVGSGSISSNGGSSASPGGEGAAGRVKVNITTWARASSSDLITMSKNNKINVSVMAGTVVTSVASPGPSATSGKSARNGTLIATSCPPGFQPRNYQFICEACPDGYYSSTYDLTPCKKCLNNIGSITVNFAVSRPSSQGEQ